MLVLGISSKYFLARGKSQCIMGFLRLENSNVDSVKKVLIQENKFKKNRQNFPNDGGMQAFKL